MKKALLILAAFFLVSTFSFAQDALEEIVAAETFEKESTKTYVVIPEDQHVEDKNAKIRIEYNAAFGEARVYYETLYSTYDRAQAMNAVMLCLQDFTSDHQYYHYRYLKDDKEKFFKDDRGQRKAQYMSYVKFDR